MTGSAAGNSGWVAGQDAMQQAQGVAAEDPLDVGRREAAGLQQGGQVGELVVAGQDRAVVSVQVGADGHVGRAGHFGEPDDLGAEIGQRAAALAPAATTASRIPAS